MAAKEAKKPNIATVHYMGRDYEVDADAIMATRVQRAMADSARNPAGAYDAIDTVLRGKLDELLDVIPEADGEVGPYGASVEALGGLMQAAAEQVTGSKN